MSKKFKNIENDEEFKNFKIEDYLPSMNTRKQKATPLMMEEETTVMEDVDEATLFPPLGKPDTSEMQAAIADTIAHNAAENMATEVSEQDADMEKTPEAVETLSERTIVRRVSSKQRRLSLDEYRSTFLQVPKIADRKPVFVSHEVRDRLDRIVRYFGVRGMSVSGLVENLVRHHLATYGNDIEQWRKL